MLKNNNLKVCLTLALRELRFHRAKNVLLALVAMLVTGLYSFSFLIGDAIRDSFLLNYEYSYGSASHMLFMGLTEHQADAVAQDAAVKDTVRLRTIGQLTDPMIGSRSVKLAVTDMDYAETVLSVPETGQMPEEADEIALDVFTMDSLGVPHELGAPVTIAWTDPQGTVSETTFQLSGWWESPTNYTEACAWITRESAESLSPGYGAENAANLTLGVTLHQPKDLEAQAQEILTRQGIGEVPYTTSLVYNDALQENAGQQMIPYLTPDLLVLLCGFLMICAIIQIALERDMAFYAGIKALGMSPRQIRRLLFLQSCIISGLGLIPGWLLGFGLDYMIAGRLISGMEENPALMFLSVIPFLLAGLGTFLTCAAAYLFSGLRMERMTPAQAFTVAQTGKKGRLPAKAGKPAVSQVSLPRLAVRTLLRKRLRMAVSAIALLLSVIFLCMTWMEYEWYSEERFLAYNSPWDYVIADGSAATSYQRYNPKAGGITKETISELGSRSEVTEIGYVRTCEATLTAPDFLVERLSAFYNGTDSSGMTRRESMEGYPLWQEGLRRLEEERTYTALILAVDDMYWDYILENSPVLDGAFDLEKFHEGGYVVTGGAYAEGISSLAAGETVELGGENFEVMTTLMFDAEFLVGSNSPEAEFCLIYAMPMEEFERLFPDMGIRQAAVNIDKTRQESFEAYLADWKEEQNRGVSVTMRSEWQEYCDNARLNEVLPPLIVGLVLFGIALLVFIDMLATKTIVRRREFAVYQSLGMTKAQLQKLLLTEGLLHGALLIVILLPVTEAVTRYLAPRRFSTMNSWAMEYTFTLAPLWIALPVLLVISAAVPVICLHFLTKGSITERMRSPE